HCGPKTTQLAACLAFLSGPRPSQDFLHVSFMQTMPDRPRPEHMRGGHADKKSPAPEPTGFAAFGLLPQLLHNIEKAGWVTPSPIQQELIPLAVQGHDLYGVAQTGTGKTASFALPALHMLAGLPRAPKLQPYCMVLAPTRELVQQIEQQFSMLGEGL